MVGYSLGIKAEAEAKATLPFFAKLLASLSSTIKVESEDQKEIRRKIKVYPDHLIDNLNLLLKDARDKLKTKNKDLLIIIDNLDRYHPEEVANLLIKDGDLLKRIRTNIIYTPPLQLYHLTQREGESLQSKWNCEILPSVKVKKKNGRDFNLGIDRLKEVILKRIDQSLFSQSSLIDKFILMSGGNIRDLMRLLRYACEETSEEMIDKDAIAKAILKLKNEYKAEIPGKYYSNLANVARENDLNDPNEITIDALFHRYILKYNGDEWYDVHPIVKEIEAYKRAVSYRGKKGKGR